MRNRKVAVTRPEIPDTSKPETDSVPEILESNKTEEKSVRKTKTVTINDKAEIIPPEVEIPEVVVPETSKSEQAKKQLKEILARAEKLKISPRDFGELRSVNKLLGLDRKKRGVFQLLRGHFWMFMMAAIFLARFFPVDIVQTELLRAWFSFYRIAIDSEKCVSYVPDSVSNLFRPPEDCSICSNVTRVDKVNNISPEEFEERYVQTGYPVVVTDAMASWSAQHVFDFHFFKQIYEESSANWVFQSACQFFPYKTEFKQLKDVFKMEEARANMSRGTEPWYVGWSNCDERVSRILRQHYEPPYFLPQTSENKQTDWIFMGSPGYGAKMHIDNVNYASWQAQLKGKKTWTLQPPLECYYKCPTLTVDVLPGEIIVLDTNRWYHQTEITSEELSITIGAEFD